MVAGFDLGCAHTHIAAFEAAAGRLMDWDRVYINGTSEPAAGTSTWSTAMASAAAGRRVCISGKSAGTWAAIAGGSKDALWTSWANYAATFPTPGIWCFYHEPEDNTGASPNSATDFRNATARIDSIMQPILHPAGWRTAICLMDWTFDTRSGRDPLDWLSLSTDIILVDAYDYRGAQNPPSDYADEGSTPRDPETFFHVPGGAGGVNRDMMAFASSRGKGFGFGEVGFLRELSDTAGAERSAAIAAVADYIRAQGIDIDDCEMAMYFELGPTDGFKADEIRGEPASIAAFVDWAPAVVTAPDVLELVGWAAVG